MKVEKATALRWPFRFC